MNDSDIYNFVCTSCCFLLLLSSLANSKPIENLQLSSHFLQAQNLQGWLGPDPLYLSPLPYS